MKSASGAARNRAAKHFRSYRIATPEKVHDLWAALPHAEIVFQEVFRRETATWATSSEGGFESVELSDQENRIYWLKRWNVTNIQLKIAVSRAGTDPLSVKQEIFGSRTSDQV